MASKKRGLLMRFFYLFALASLVAVGLLGWNWLNGLVCHSIRITGNVEAQAADIVAAARVDTGGALFAIDPALIADRVRRHPWVKSANVTRLPPSTLLIDVEERLPALLVIDAGGIPSAHLDPDGYVMPVTAHSTFDLPLIAGVKLPTNPNEAIESRAVRDLLRSMSTLQPQADLLISSFVVEADGQITLHSVPVNSQRSITVRLGRRAFDEKLMQLHAFWHQAILTRPDRSYELIDLRFESQIVTRESTES